MNIVDYGTLENRYQNVLSLGGMFYSTLFAKQGNTMKVFICCLAFYLVVSGRYFQVQSGFILQDISLRPIGKKR